MKTTHGDLQKLFLAYLHKSFIQLIKTTYTIFKTI